VVVEHRELRLRGPQRHLLVLERDARRKDRVLELVVALGELGRDQPTLTGLAQAVEPFALIDLGALLFVPQRMELIAAEEILVTRDDRGLLRDLLLAHANGAPL